MALSATNLSWPEWLSRRESSDYLKEEHGVQAGYSSLSNLASRGGGPKFSRQGDKPGGRVIYHRQDLDEWARSRMSQRVSSTSELREHEAAA
jgi:hypothetical protein